MNRFMLLPAEIRHKIWLDCLPVRPTTHFFEVVNHPRNHIWPAEEFCIRATRAYNSGYLAIYALLAICREARLVVAAHYNCVCRAANFETFDWIPTDDLVVLSAQTGEALTYVRPDVRARICPLYRRRCLRSFV